MEIYHQQHFSLLDAAMDGQLAVAQRLIDEGEDIEQRSSNGTTALLNAVMYSHDEIVKLLLEHGAEVDVRIVPEQITPLMVSCSNGTDDISKILLRAGGDPKLVDQHGNTVLHYAAFATSLSLIKKIFNAAPDQLDSDNDKGNTPVLIAAQEGRFEVVKWFLKQPIEIERVNKVNQNLLLVLVKSSIQPDRELESIFDLLAPLVSFNNHRAWFASCMLGRKYWVSHMMNWKLDINLQDEYGNSGLHYAVAGQHYEIVTLLLQNGADPNLQSNESQRPIDLANTSMDQKMGELLSNG
ncbi:MAG: ankyrin repeat domain-containing protein [Bacteroidota bacterium]